MTQIAIASKTMPNYQGGGSTATLKIFANKSFVASDGAIINKDKVGGPTWYESIACTVSGNVLTIPEITLDSTTNSDNPTATYTGVLYDANGGNRGELFKGYRVPTSLGVSTTWPLWIAYQESRVAILHQGSYTQDYLNNVFAEFTAAIAGIVSSTRRIDQNVTSVLATQDDTWEDGHVLELPAGQLETNGDTVSGKFSGVYAGDNANAMQVRFSFAGFVLMTADVVTASTTTGWEIAFSITRRSSGVVVYSIRYGDTAESVELTAEAYATSLSVANDIAVQIRAEQFGLAQVEVQASYLDYTPAAA